MKKYLILLLGFVLPYGLTVAQKTLSQQASISLLTCDPGDDLYNTFGHSAVRVVDPLNNIDAVFNYGTFSFGGDSFKDQVKFGVTFARGTLLYQLSVGGYENFVSAYQYQKRSVYEQVLQLNQSQKQQMFNDLYINSLPENKYYQYDFFYDNCSSRIRDIVGATLGDDLRYAQGESIRENSGVTFMDMIDPYIKYSPWVKWGIYVLLGAPANEDASEYEQMFLPDFLMMHFGQAQIYNGSEWVPLVAQTNTIYQSPAKTKSNTCYKTPLFFFGVIFLIFGYLSYRNYQFDKHNFWIDYLLFGVTGLMGVLLVFMWFGTDHITTKWNLNLAWAIPFNLVALFFLKKKSITNYLLVILGITILLLIGWAWLPQRMHIAFLPLVALMLIRYLKLLSWHRNKPVSA